MWLLFQTIICFKKVFIGIERERGRVNKPLGTFQSLLVMNWKRLKFLQRLIRRKDQFGNPVEGDKSTVLY